MPFYEQLLAAPMEWISMARPEQLVLAFMALLAAVFLLLIALIVQRRSNRRPNRSTNRPTSHITKDSHPPIRETFSKASPFEIKATMLQIQEANAYHQEVLEKAKQALVQCQQMLQTESMDPHIAKTLAQTNESADRLQHKIHTLHQSLHAKAMADLNQALPGQSDGTLASTDPAVAEMQPSEQAFLDHYETLNERLLSLQQSLAQVWQFHDRPGTARHEQALHALATIDSQWNGLALSLSQSAQELEHLQTLLVGNECDV